MINNSSGKIYYGMHFYPGVAEYSEPGKQPYRIFINEDTIRSMDASFAGKPIFVEHVDEVSSNIDELRKEADGWVIESFYNKADGKHWVKFVIVSEQGERAIRSGMKLSNAYIPMGMMGEGGLWNGVQYNKEVTSGEFEHLAIVSKPRYEESIILTPEQFKKYNSDKEMELLKIANSKDKGEHKMKLSFFKKQIIENASDLEAMMVTLPKSGKELKLTQVINEYDTVLNMHGYASGDHMVKVGNEEMSVNDLVKKHMDMCNEMEALKAPKKENEGEEDEAKENDQEPTEKADMKPEGAGEYVKEKAENETSKESEGKDTLHKEEVDVAGDKKNEEDEDEKKKKNEEGKEEKKKNSKAKFDDLKDAHLNPIIEAKRFELSEDQIARGKQRYGSN